MRASLRSLALLTVVVGCSARTNPTGSETSDASVASPVTTAARPSSPLEHLTTLPVRLDAGAQLSRVGSGYRFAGFAPNGKGRFSNLGYERFVSTAPARSGDPVHVGVLGKDGESFIEVVAEDLARAPSKEASIERGALVFRSPVSSVDVVHVLEPGRAEELRIVHQPKPEIVTRHRITPGRGVREVRARERGLEVVSTEGQVVLATAPIVAWDAKGGEVPTTIALREEKGAYVLETRVDSNGRAFPITIDPTWAPTVPLPPVTHDPIFAFALPASQWVFAGSGSTLESRLGRDHRGSDLRARRSPGDQARRRDRPGPRRRRLLGGELR